MRPHDDKLIWNQLTEAIDDKGEWSPEPLPPKQGPDGVEMQKGSVWDSQGKALKVGDMVKHEREDAEFIVLHVGENDVQLAELGEGIMAQGKELTIMDQDSMGY